MANKLKIEESPSPNQSSRKNAPICMLLYHYTGAARIEGSVSWFSMDESNVSAHYLIGRRKLAGLDQTQIVSTVPDGKKAWHAGASEWLIDEDLYLQTRAGSSWELPKRDGKRLVTGVNQCSIGIELVGRKDEEFPDIQMWTAARLTRWLLDEYPYIWRSNCVGHEHVAIPSGRKVDPGPLFDWVLLWQYVVRLGAARSPGVVSGPRTPTRDLELREEEKMASGDERRRDKSKAQWRAFVARLQKLGIA